MSERLPELTGAARARVDELLAESEEYFTAGDIRSALELSLQAWEEIPEPKAAWDYYPQTLVVGFVEDFAALGDAAAVRAWIPLLFRVYRDEARENHYTLLVAGTALFTIGDEAEAAVMFRRIHALFGRVGLRGLDPRFRALALG